AAGVAALYSAGVYQGKEVEGGLKYLLRNKNNAQNPHFRFAMRRDLPDIHYYYGHYYAAQVMWTAGGKYWSEWYPFIRDELLERAGSSGKDGAWEDQIDSHYATAMACIILQIPNNYLPIMQK
ncbi:MAG TPA: prenyltransferase, partial [Gemmataceae bacterium]|nr:prenyltransferase [Gemmataceae bacterium]